MELGEKTDVFQSEDIYATTTAETAYFKVFGDNELVYEGKATVFPDGGEIRVYLNRIARGLLDAGQLPTTSGLTSSPHGVVYLVISFYDEEGGTINDALPALRVYQGAGDFPTAGMLMTTCSINGHADPRMLLFAGFSARYSFNVTIE